MYQKYRYSRRFKAKEVHIPWWGLVRIPYGEMHLPERGVR